MANRKKKSQRERILGHLRRGTITPIKAWERYGVYRLSAVIKALRDEDYDIDTDTVQAKNHFGETMKVARYRLVGEPL